MMTSCEYVPDGGDYAQVTTTVPRPTSTTPTPSCGLRWWTGWAGCSATSASRAGGWTLRAGGCRAA